MKNHELIDLLMDRVNNMCKRVKLVMVPSKGWNYEISCFVTSVLINSSSNTIYISNAFSDKDKDISVHHMLNLLSSDINASKYFDIAFEIYAFDGVNGPIIRYIPENVENILITNNNDNNYIEIKISVDKIRRVSITYPKKELY